MFEEHATVLNYSVVLKKFPAGMILQKNATGMHTWLEVVEER